MSASCYIASDWLIDGTGQPHQSRALIEIRGPLVHSVTPADQVSGRKTSGDGIRFREDFRGCTILPALVDSHVHLVMSGNPEPSFREEQLCFGYEAIQSQITHHCDKSFRFGVLAVRDGGDKNAYTLRFRDELQHIGQRPRIYIQYAGKAWHRQGRYGGLIGRAPEQGQTLREAAAGSRQQAAVIKIVNAGLNSLRTFGKQTKPQFSSTELKELVQTAHAGGQKVMVHANGVEPVGMAVAAGCDSIEHGFFMGTENLRKMSDKAVVWVPTAVTMQAYARVMQSDAVVAEGAQMNLDHQLDQIRLARQYGVRVAVGTDAGSPGVHHGQAVAEEIGLLRKAGYTIEEAVAGSTAIGSDLLGLTQAGRITSGMEASFIVVPGPPEHLPDSLHHIERIYRAGKPVYSKRDNAG